MNVQHESSEERSAGTITVLDVSVPNHCSNDGAAISIVLAAFSTAPLCSNLNALTLTVHGSSWAVPILTANAHMRSRSRFITLADGSTGSHQFVPKDSCSWLGSHSWINSPFDLAGAFFLVRVAAGPTEERAGNLGVLPVIRSAFFLSSGLGWPPINILTMAQTTITKKITMLILAHVAGESAPKVTLRSTAPLHLER